MEDPKFKAIYDKISKEIDNDEQKAKKRMINKEKERRVRPKQSKKFSVDDLSAKYRNVSSKKATNEEINKIRQEAWAQKYHTIPKSPVSIEKMNETIKGGWRKLGKTIFDKKMEDPKFKALFDREYVRLEIDESKAKRKPIKINKSIKFPK
jgi:hypothetical protein